MPDQHADSGLLPFGDGSPITVSQLTRRIQGALESAFPGVSVVGEVSNIYRARSGHLYLTLKDADSQVRVVAWRRTASALKFDVTDGMEIVVQGGISVYPPRGEYQLVAKKITPKGMGALELAFRQLCEKLKKEGLFDEEHKKPLPFLPRRIAIVTSAGGAAIHDMLTVIRRRHPRVHILIRPVLVQGEGAAQQIAEAIRDINEQIDCDVIITGRGGGSTEDLWAFNEEVVARAIFASRIPVISAVGHEIDISVSDLVADLRAKTPTEAAELVLPREVELRRELDTLVFPLYQHTKSTAAEHRAELDRLRSALELRSPARLVERQAQTCDDLWKRLVRAAGTRLERSSQELAGLYGKLTALNPRAILGRGYSITTDAETGKAVLCASEVARGRLIVTQLDEGRLSSRVEDTQPDGD